MVGKSQSRRLRHGRELRIGLYVAIGIYGHLCCVGTYMSNFFSSIHCRSRCHCRVCRDTGPRGRDWRASLAGVFCDLSSVTPDFACPAGRPWASVPLPAPCGFVALVGRIAALSPATSEARLLQAMAAQLSDLYRRAPRGSCGCSRSTLQSRLFARLRYYCTLYAPALLTPGNPLADPPSPPACPPFAPVQKTCK